MMLVPSTAKAVFLGNSDFGKEYLLGVEDLSKWCGGIYVESMNRKVGYNGLSQTMELDRSMLYVGYNFMPWITTYITAGSGPVSLTNDPDPFDGDTSMGVGMHFNLLDHDIMDPTLFENSIRINGRCEYTFNSIDGLGIGEWQEIQISLTLSIINDLNANILYLPKAIGLFAGPVFSDILFGDIDEETKTGAFAGMEVYYSERVSFYGGVLTIGDSSTAFGLHVRF